jgi:putative ABC transport system substrate-binding protein
LIVGAFVWGGTFPALAQQPNKTIIGFLHSASADPESAYWPALAAFRRCLAKDGYVEGQNLEIEFRWAEDRFDRLPALAADLVKRKVALMFAGGGDVAALAAKKATTEIPIVFAIGADPVKQGLVTSLNRPGGNLTGSTFLSVELRPKTLELIRELVPTAKVIGVLANPNRPKFQPLLNEVLSPAHALGLEVRVLRAGNEHEIDSAMASLATSKVDALMVLSDPVFFNRREQLARLERKYQVPTIHSTKGNVTAGSLVSYGASIEEAYCQAAVYAGRILRGEKPSDLPVQQPTKLELVINLKTAKALGLNVPPSVLARADEVIE